MKFAAMAASLLLVVSLLAWWVPTVESPRAFGEEFGRALKQVCDGHSMSYVQEMTIEGKKHTIITKDFIAEDGRKRTEQADVTTIFDTTGQIRLSLLARTHTVLVREAKEDSGINAGKMFLSWLRRLKDQSDRPEKALGRKELDGHQVIGFVAAEGKRTFTMWIDYVTGEPVRVEYDSQVHGAASHITMKDFHFHQNLDESLFSFEVPAGYRVYGRPKDGKTEPTAGLELAWSRKGDLEGRRRCDPRADRLRLGARRPPGRTEYRRCGDRDDQRRQAGELLPRGDFDRRPKVPVFDVPDATIDRGL